MCGLFGATSNYLSPSEIENVINLGILSSIRGKDSSGVALISESQKKGQKYRVHLTKRTYSSAALLSDINMIKYLHDKNKGEKYCILGHSRLATLGRITEVNAHPHMYDHIIGTHNGTIDEYVEKVKDFYVNEKDEKCEYYRPVNPNENDSQILFKKMATTGVLPTLKDVEEKKGAAAIAFVDYQEQTLNLYRNYQRPLYIAYSQDASTVYWASDDKIIDLLRNNGDKWSVGIPLMVKPHTLYTFKLGIPAKQSLKETEIKEKEKVVTIFQSRGSGGSSSSTQELFHSQKNKSNCYKEYWTGFYPMFSIAEERAKEILATGCANCPKVSETWESTWWANEYEHVCDNCYNSPFIQEYAVETGVKFVESTVEWK